MFFALVVVNRERVPKTGVENIKSGQASPPVLDVFGLTHMRVCVQPLFVSVMTLRHIPAFVKKPVVINVPYDNAGNSYPLRRGRESIAFPLSLFVNRSFTGSQPIF